MFFQLYVRNTRGSLTIEKKYDIDNASKCQKQTGMVPLNSMFVVQIFTNK